MTQVPTQDGTIPFAAPGTDKSCSTYYKIVGDRSNGVTPMIYLHGGPGGGHEYLTSFAEQLWTRYAIPGVLYDQLGCASSTRLPEKAGDESFWTVELFMAELDNLIDHLGLRSGFDLFGQSWGGMFGSSFATTRPPGLRRLVLASAISSRELMVKGTKLLRAQLDPEQQAILNEAEKNALNGNFDDWDSPAVKEITALTFQKHVCRTSPVPPELGQAFKNLTENTTVYRTMCV